MRLTQVTAAYPPSTGGMELHVYRLAREVELRGHEVRVVTKPLGRGEDGDASIEVLERANPIRLRRDLASADLLHAHGSRSPYTAIAVLRAPPETPLVFTPHCFYPPRNLASRVKRALHDPILERRLLRRADRIISLTPADRADAIRLGADPARCTIIPPGVDFKLNDDMARKAVSSRELPESYAVFTGRIDATKNVEFLIDALPHLLERELALVIVGPDGGRLASVRSKLQLLPTSQRARVHILGAVTREDLIGAVAGARVLVLPSLYEGLPASLLEAAGLGVPIVATEVGGTPYLIAELETGFGFPLNDSVRFATALDEALACSPAMTERTSAYVRARYNWDVVSSMIVREYESLAP